MTEIKTVFHRRTTVKTIVRAMATKNDLSSSTNRYLVPENGGHTVAESLLNMDGDKFKFRLHNGDVVYFDTLDNIWLL